MAFHNPVFHVELPDEAPRTFYLRIQTDSSTAADLALWSPPALREAEQVELLVFGIIIGMMMMSLAFALLNWMINRNRFAFVCRPDRGPDCHDSCPVWPDAPVFFRPFAASRRRTRAMDFRARHRFDTAGLSPATRDSEKSPPDRPACVCRCVRLARWRRFYVNSVFIRPLAAFVAAPVHRRIGSERMGVRSPMADEASGSGLPVRGSHRHPGVSADRPLWCFSGCRRLPAGWPRAGFPGCWPFLY